MVSRLSNLNANYESLAVEARTTKGYQPELLNKVNDLAQQIIHAQNELNSAPTQDIHSAEQLAANKEAHGLGKLAYNVNLLKGNLTKSQFTATDTRSVFKKIKDAIINTVTSKMQRLTRGQLFLEFNSSKSFLSNMTRLSLTENKLESLKNHITDLESKKDKLCDQISIALRDENPDTVKKLEAKLHSTTSKLADLKSTELDLNKKLETLQKKTGRRRSNTEKGQFMRANLASLGGERIEMKTPDGVKLDGMYLDAKAFKKTLADAGCKLATLSLGKDNLQVLVMPASEKAGKVEQVLENMKAIRGNENMGSGWSAVRSGDDLIFVRTEDLGKNSIFKSSFAGSPWQLSPEAAMTENAVPLDTESNGRGTVILTSGNAGVYEGERSQPLYFLMNDMNVVMFNFRGYGESEGEPTEHGLKMDMETAYQLAKAKSGHEDRQIMFKALCMSGGPAADCAANHPETNLFLDQTYSSMKQLVAEQASNDIGQLLGKNEAKGIEKEVKSALSDAIGKFVSWFAPDFNTAKSLKNVEGKKAIYFTADDELIAAAHVNKNLASIAKAGQMDYTMVFQGEGAHGSSLLGLGSSDFSPMVPTDLGRSYMDQFLKSARIGNPIIPHDPTTPNSIQDISNQFMSLVETFKTFNPLPSDVELTPPVNADTRQVQLLLHLSSMGLPEKLAALKREVNVPEEQLKTIQEAMVLGEQLHVQLQSNVMEIATLMEVDPNFLQKARDLVDFYKSIEIATPELKELEAKLSVIDSEQKILNDIQKMALPDLNAAASFHTEAEDRYNQMLSGKAEGNLELIFDELSEEIAHIKENVPALESFTESFALQNQVRPAYERKLSSFNSEMNRMEDSLNKMRSHSDSINRLYVFSSGPKFALADLEKRLDQMDSQYDRGEIDEQDYRNGLKELLNSAEDLSNTNRTAFRDVEETFQSLISDLPEFVETQRSLIFKSLSETQNQIDLFKSQLSDAASL